MLRQQAKLFNRLAILSDHCLIVFAFFSAYGLRFQWHKNLHPWQEYVWVLLIALPAWTLLLHQKKLYASIRRLSLFDISIRTFNALFQGGLIVAAFIYFFDRHHYSRSLYGLFVLIALLFLIVEKVSLRLLLGYIRKKGLNSRNIIIVGTCEKANEFCQLVHKHDDWGIRVLGFVQVEAGPLKESIAGHRVLGRINDLIDICKSYPIDEVAFCLHKRQVVDVDAYFKQLEELGVTQRVVLDFFDVTTIRKEVSIFHDSIPIVTYYSKAFDSQQLLFKRLLDICGAFVGLGIFVLMFPFVAVAIKVNSPGPVFFSQERVGESGRRFKCWKLRSMYVDAEARKKDLMAHNEMNGAIFKIKNDPRITSVGKIIRKTSLDEFPQFWNVLIGNMSLVGTRPPTPDEVSQYENWHRRRISIKPGLTGLWQVSGRNKVSDFDDIVKLDLQYIDRWSLGLDLRIILKTIWVVLARRGSS